MQIDPNAIYRPEDVKAILKIGSMTLGYACKSGKLKFAQQGRQRFFRGQWLLDYVDNSVIQNQSKTQTA